MRFLVTDQDVTLSVLESGLRKFDPDYSIERDDESDSEGLLKFANDLYGQIEVNRPGDDLFDEEISELIDFINDCEGERKPEVLKVLDHAVAIVCIRVLHQGRDDESTLVRIDPLWRWLFANRNGLMQADDEGYYDVSGLILPTE